MPEDFDDFAMPEPDELDIVLEANRQQEQRDTKSQSGKSGDYIKSQRTFGVEFEINLGPAGRGVLGDNLPSGFHLEHDGSVNNGIEVVSPILRGAAGEAQIKKVCDSMNEVGAGADESCGMHVHLGAADFYSQREAVVVPLQVAIDMASKPARYGNLSFTLIHSNTLKELKPFYRGELYSQISNMRGLDAFYLSAWDDFTSGEYAHLLPVYIAGEKEIRDNFRLAATLGARGAKIPTNYGLDESALKAYTGEPVLTGDYTRFCLVDPRTSAGMLVIAEKAEDVSEQTRRVARLKRVAAAYSVFDDVIASMLPLDRRENDYTRRLDLHVSLTDISRVQTVLDFFTLWTKTHSLSAFRQSLRDGRHESRYHGVNFHALLKHNTIEIRYHAGTTSADKTLHWVALHQRILDLAADLDDHRLDLTRLEKANMVIDIDQKANLFFKKLALPKETETYFRKRIAEFRHDDEQLVRSLIEDYNE